MRSLRSWCRSDSASSRKSRPASPAADFASSKRPSVTRAAPTPKAKRSAGGTASKRSGASSDSALRINQASVMEAGLKKMDLRVKHEIHDPVFLRQTSGPGIRCQIFQELWLSRSTEGVAKNVFDQVQSTKGNSAISLDPKSQVFPELRMKHRLSFDSR